MLRICVVEDEKESLDRLTEMIDRYCKEHGQKYELTKYGDGMNFASDYRPVYDAVFMDIEMPYLNGMQAAKKLRETDANVTLVFVTHLAKYALQGYEVDAAGFLIKPIEYPSLRRQLDKIISREKFAVGGMSDRFFSVSADTYCRYIQFSVHTDIHCNNADT